MNAKLEEKLVEYEKTAPIVSDEQLIEAIRFIIEEEEKQPVGERDLDLIEQAVEAILVLQQTDIAKLDQDAAEASDALIQSFYAPATRRAHGIRLSRFLPIAAALCAVFAVVSFFVFALVFVQSGDNRKVNDSMVDSNVTHAAEPPETPPLRKGEFIKEEIQVEKAYSVDGASIPMTYQKTEVRSDGTEIDVYAAGDGYEYEFGADGELVGKAMSAETLSQSSLYVGAEKTTESKAIEIAKKVAREQFGDKFDLVIFDNIHQDEGNGDYAVTFYQRLGKDGFVKGITCYATMLSDGTLLACGMPNYDALIGFDPSLLDGITRDVVCSAFDEYLCDRYGDRLVDHEVDDIMLMCKNGEYYLRVPVNEKLYYEDIFDGETMGQTFGNRETYVYPLTQKTAGASVGCDISPEFDLSAILGVTDTTVASGEPYFCPLTQE